MSTLGGAMRMAEGDAFGSGGGSPASDGGRRLRDVGGWLARVHLRLPVSVFGKKQEHLLDSDSRLLPLADYVERLRWSPVDHNHAYDHLFDRWSAWAELIFAGVTVCPLRSSACLVKQWVSPTRCCSRWSWVL